MPRTRADTAKKSADKKAQKKIAKASRYAPIKKTSAKRAPTKKALATQAKLIATSKKDKSKKSTPRVA